MTELPLDFCGPESGKSSGLSSGTLMNSGCFDAMSLYWNLPEEGATLGLLLPKTRQIMVFLVQNTSLYRVHDFDPLANPWSVFLHQPITIQHSLSLINFWVWWAEPTLLIKGNPPAGIKLSVPCMCRLLGKPS